MTNESTKNDNDCMECFVIMPFSDSDGDEEGHFIKVYQDVFKPSIEMAGFKPYRTDDNKSTSLIHLDILRKLIDSPMCLCDLSNRNPNVLFELGIRQAFDKPVVLVQEKGTARIFDISGINTIDYHKDMKYRQVIEDQKIIADAIKSTYEDSKNKNSINSIVKLLSLNSPAVIPETDLKKDPVLHLILNEISSLKATISKTLDKNHMDSIRESQLSTFELDLDNDKLLEEYTFLNKIFHELNNIVANDIRNKSFIDPDIMNKIESIMIDAREKSSSLNPLWIGFARKYEILYKKAFEYNLQKEKA